MLGGHPGDLGASTVSEEQSGQGHVTVCVGEDSELRGCPFRTRQQGRTEIGKGFR